MVPRERSPDPGTFRPAQAQSHSLLPSANGLLLHSQLYDTLDRQLSLCILMCSPSFYDASVAAKSWLSLGKWLSADEDKALLHSPTGCTLSPMGLDKACTQPALYHCSQSTGSPWVTWSSRKSSCASSGPSSCSEPHTKLEAICIT